MASTHYGYTDAKAKYHWLRMPHEVRRSDGIYEEMECCSPDGREYTTRKLLKSFEQVGERKEKIKNSLLERFFKLFN